MSFLFHEKLSRSGVVMAKLRAAHVTVCGAGALGSHIVEGLARSGVGALRVIDRDKVEERNLSTQPWTRADIGQPKARLLAHSVFRAVGVQVDARAKELTSDNARALIRGSSVVVDAFDNSVGRAAVKAAAAKLGLPCVHAGMAGDSSSSTPPAGYSEVVWDPHYVVPSATNDDVCDYPLARNLAILTSAIAAETVIRFLASGTMENRALTFGDLKLTTH